MKEYVIRKYVRRDKMIVKFLESSLHFRNIFINRIMHHLILFNVTFLSLHSLDLFSYTLEVSYTHKK